MHCTPVVSQTAKFPKQPHARWMSCAALGDLRHDRRNPRGLGSRRIALGGPRPLLARDCCPPSRAEPRPDVQHAKPAPSHESESEQANDLSCDACPRQRRSRTRRHLMRANHDGQCAKKMTKVAVGRFRANAAGMMSRRFAMVVSDPSQPRPPQLAAEPRQFGGAHMNQNDASVKQSSIAKASVSATPPA